MKMRFLKPTIITGAALLAAWLPLSGALTAQAISSCPTDPLSNLMPHVTSVSDSDPINVGVKFQVKGAPYVSGVKFYKGTGNTGTHVAHLYDVTATYTSETSSGWQTVDFSSEVQVRDDHNYIVWVSMPNGHYAADSPMVGGDNYFGTMYGHGFGNSEDVVTISQGDNGVYGYTSDDSVVPGSSYAANYWVSPVVGDGTTPQNSSGYSSSAALSGRTLSWSTTGKDTNSATSTGQIVRTKLIRQQGEIFDVVGYQTGNNSSITDPSAPRGIGYSYRVINVDACGNESNGSSVASPAGTSHPTDNLFSSDPTSVDTAMTDPATIGMRWKTATAGNISAVRIHRAADTAPTDDKQLTVGVWDTSGNLLASRSLLPGNQEEGWIDVQLTSPLSVAANTDYIVGYFTPNGRESYTNNTFDNAVTNGDLSAPASTMGAPNGVYSLNSTMAFPSTAATNNTWYGIDVDFYLP